MSKADKRHDAAQRAELVATVRAWARQHRPDLGVGPTGRLSQQVWDAYDTALAPPRAVSEVDGMYAWSPEVAE